MRVIRSDHRGNSRRTTRNLEQFLAVDNALLVISGMHSPPLLANRAFINENHILTLDPWAAAGPITRSQGENWLYRLSLDDRYAGEVMAKHAVEHRGMTKPVMLLEETGWGKNYNNMSTVFDILGLPKVPVIWFKWGIGEDSADIIMRQIVAGGHDGAIMVANANEGAVLTRAMARLDAEQRSPIISHWGITGGNFHNMVPSEERQLVDLTFLQTSFSFLDSSLSPFAQTVWSDAIALHADMPRSPRQLRAPSGFIHALDLGSILMMAAEKVSADKARSAKEVRQLLRNRLETLQDPIQGLVKTYTQPFSQVTNDNPDGHEALSKENIVFARFSEDDAIELTGP